MALLWTPAAIDCSFWLDPNDASTVENVSNTVASITDKSGNGNIASQATAADRPDIVDGPNSTNIMYFDGTDYLTCLHDDSLNLANGATIAIVYKTTAGFRLFQKKTGGPGTETDSYFSGQSGIFGIGGAFSTELTSNDNTWKIDIGRWDNNVISSWRNGSKITYTTVQNATIVAGDIDPTNTPTNNNDALNIGRRDYSSGSSGIITGNIAEIVFLQRAVTAAERQLLEGYLAHKYGQTALLPSDHPYKAAPPYDDRAITITESIACNQWDIYNVRLIDNALTKLTVDTTSQAEFSVKITHPQGHLITVAPAMGLGWQASTVYALNDKVFPTDPTTTPYYYECTVAGTSNSTEPTWPTTSGNTVTDNTVTWQCVERMVQPITHGPLIPS